MQTKKKTIKSKAKKPVKKTALKKRAVAPAKKVIKKKTALKKRTVKKTDVKIPVVKLDVIVQEINGLKDKLNYLRTVKFVWNQYYQRYECHFKKDEFNNFFNNIN